MLYSSFFAFSVLLSLHHALRSPPPTSAAPSLSGNQVLVTLGAGGGGSDDMSVPPFDIPVIDANLLTGPYDPVSFQGVVADTLPTAPAASTIVLGGVPLVTRTTPPPYSPAEFDLKGIPRFDTNRMIINIPGDLVDITNFVAIPHPLSNPTKVPGLNALATYINEQATAAGISTYLT
jgi:hypothetical protein